MVDVILLASENVVRCTEPQFSYETTALENNLSEPSEFTDYKVKC